MKPTVNSLWKSAVLAVLVAPICLVAVRAAPADTAESQTAKAKLAAVRAKITALTQHLGTELAERDSLNGRLRQVELAITEKRRALDGLHSAELGIDRRRTLLRQERKRADDALSAARAELAGQVRAAYMSGRHDELKLLLNQSSPARVGRMSAYFGYLGRARAAEITAIGAQVERLQSLGRQIDEQSLKLTTVADEIRRDLQDLEHSRAERTVLLATISKQLKQGDQDLAALKREAQGLESLLADLAAVLQDFPTDAAQSFAQMRGKLPWPVPGRLAAHYHDLRAEAPQGSLRWNGILIEAARGEKVRAPYFGRVIYADWLQGLGLLMIISHSGGYLSLYGHAEILYKSVGDWVAPGDLIASLREAEGEKPRLYFEIRQGRKPLDPKLWLK